LQQAGWQNQLALGNDDLNIATQQITNAKDQVRIAAQQLTIAQIQAQQKSDIAEFLINKFTNAALYTWMSGVLQGVYSYFLREATAVASSAENQMAFERQVTPPGFIKADYWQPPSASGSSAATANTAGLTGSARLTQDIYELDSYYQDTNQRKLQLTKILSLSQLFPLAFQQLRDTGVMNFTTAMGLFDQDFPGHYLRLINKVSVTVIALIPPRRASGRRSRRRRQRAWSPGRACSRDRGAAGSAIDSTLVAHQCHGRICIGPAVKSPPAVSGARRRGAMAIHDGQIGKPV